ncbi:MAG TPA: UDP-N-acetylglucosamine 1-carboxyvinyltransferase [Clostridiales bacterium]|nr:UDP-N-acetylglucosamine 1-carboxyvinyltransferase [Clostridia bacterium]HCF65861.1 UDP-N-acetylglucosamine 1-carboxyvinyltransferase [Clostridiales bacterium]
MDKFVIKGGTRLKGEVTISGAKNAAVAILPATLLINGVCTIDNLPNISDVKIFCEILTKLGAKITWNTPNEITIDTRNIDCTNAPLEMTSKFRASYYLLGALLGRCGCAEVGIPGGCNLGARPIDQHIKGFEALGAKVDVGQGKISAKVKKLVANSIYMDIVSVGATINVMLASVLAEGTTTIDNAAKEPHIVDVANFLNSMGADIRGAGTDVIKINGVKELSKEGTYSVVPDQIETGTFMLAAVASKGDILIKNCIPEHLDCVTAKILEIGGVVEDLGDSIRVACSKRPNRATVKTLPYPGFPTDLQPQMGVVLSIAEGNSTINESIWDSRFQYTNELNKMGAKITAQGKSAFFEGVKELSGSPVYATDLRAGSALIMAGIIAKGETQVYNIEHIDRGYENIEQKFRNLGANIKRVTE